MAINIVDNAWGGDFVQGLNTEVILGGSTVKAGLWRVEPAYGETAVFQRYDVGDDLQVGNLCGLTPTSDSTLTDLAVPLATFSVYKQLCKYDLDKTSFAMRSPASVLGKVFPREVVEAEVSAILAKNTVRLEQIRWVGDTTAANPALASQDGVGTQILQAGNANPVAAASAAAITSVATVIDELGKLVAAAPAAVQLHPKFKIVVSPAIAVAYRQALASNVALATWNMGMTQSFQGLQDGSFLGYLANTMIPMYIASGLVSNGVNDFSATAFAGIFSNDREGNLGYATNGLNDDATMVVQDRQSMFAAEPYLDIVWSMRQAIKVIRPEDIAYYHGV